MTFCYEHPRPMVTVDVLLFAGASETEILLIQRKNPPYSNAWALPGGFLDMDEDLEAAAKRELREETGIAVPSVKQFKTYGKPGRDPRGRTLTVAFTAQLDSPCAAHAMDDAKAVHWFPVNNLPPLAFDHEEIIREALGYSSS